MISNDVTFNFYPVCFSDHDIFSFQFKIFISTEFGPNYWKFNDSLLNDKNFVEKFTKFHINQTKNLDINLEYWDTLKEKIKHFCILFSKKKNLKKSLTN